MTPLFLSSSPATIPQSFLTNMSYELCTPHLFTYTLSFHQGIVSSFEQMQREWKVWYMSGKPEIEPMPADWSIKTR